MQAKETKMTDEDKAKEQLEFILQKIDANDKEAAALLSQLSKL